MDRGLDGYFDFSGARSLAGCAVLKARVRRGLDKFPVAIARGKHLFPFRTEQLSPVAPMVLGLQGPGRVGRRRSSSYTEAARRGGFCRSMAFPELLTTPRL